VTLEEYLAIPYVLTVEAVQGPDGEWYRRARYRELPGCVGEAPTPEEAIARLEEARVAYIQERLARGEPIPTPRAPLRDRLAAPATP
jgi:predicted RNase H-like HicB family nuclease